MTDSPAAADDDDDEDTSPQPMEVDVDAQSTPDVAALMSEDCSAVSTYHTPETGSPGESAET
jgi:hypothetical protein